MTTFQGARWVQPQLDSILHQTTPPSEVLVVDDGSSDGTAQMCRELLRDFAGRWVVQVNPSRLGTVRSLDSGLRQATGDVVLLADQDDVWRPRKLSRVLELLPEGIGVGAVFSDAGLVDEHGRALVGTLWARTGLDDATLHRFRQEPFHALLAGNVVTGATLALTREALDLGLPLPQRGWHDYWLALVVAAHGGRLHAEPEQLVDYRLHAGNQAGLPRSGVRARLAAAAIVRADREGNLAMLDELAGRLDDLRLMTAASEVRSARWHLDFRQGLPRRRTARLIPVGRYLVSGGYRRHGGGVLTAAADLLERRDGC